MVLPRSVHGGSKVLPWRVHGASVVEVGPWCFRGWSMALPWWSWVRGASVEGT